jgi:predicted metal-dependent hydrolase
MRVEWRAGARVPFLGRPLTVVIDPHVVGAVLRDDGAATAAHARPLHVGLPHDAAPHQIRDAVQGWLQRQARRVFEERCAQLAPRLGVRVKRLALSSAATRWGSANADGSIRLNWRLIHFALPVIDYVATHELAHLREMNHSAAFWNLVRSVLPEFERARSVLDDELLPAFE